MTGEFDFAYLSANFANVIHQGLFNIALLYRTSFSHGTLGVIRGRKRHEPAFRSIANM